MPDISHLAIPIGVLYAGLGGAILSLIVATWQNNWSCRVFFLLALRLAIGWHFLFEGLHKIHSHMTGPTETNRRFSSEMYFAAAEGPFGGVMRKQALGDPQGVIAAKLTPKKDISPADFANLPAREQAELCPDAAAAELDGTPAELAKLQTRMEERLAKLKADKIPGTEQEQLELDLEAAKKASKVLAEDPGAAERLVRTKAAYARWVYGVEADRRDAKVKFVSNADVPQTVPERLRQIRVMKAQVDAMAARDAARLGNGNGTEVKAAAAARADVRTAEADLAADADKFLATLKRDGFDAWSTATDLGKTPRPRWADADDLKRKYPGWVTLDDDKPIVRMDKMTMWVITAVGGLLIAGLFTRVACVVGAGFLLLTYLTHPAFPWYPLPPNTEGNPLFVNKNVIEALALLAIASFPTGRWMGLDALIGCCLFRRKPPAPAA